MVADRLLFQCATEPASCPLTGVKSLGIEGTEDLITQNGRRLKFFSGGGGGGGGHNFPSVKDMASKGANMWRDGVHKGIEMGIGAAKGAVEGSKEFVGRVADSMDYKQYWVPAPAVSGKASQWPVRFSNPDAFAPDSDGLIAKMKYYIDTFCEDGEIAPPEYDLAMTKEWRGSTFRFVITPPRVIFDKATMTLTVIKPRVLYQKKGMYEVKKGSFSKGAAKEKSCLFESGFAYKGKVPVFEGEGTLKEYANEYVKTYPMVRGGLAAASKDCTDGGKCETDTCPDGTNNCWLEASDITEGAPLVLIYIDLYDPETYPGLAEWFACWVPGSCPNNFDWLGAFPALTGLLGLLGLFGILEDDGNSTSPSSNSTNSTAP